MAAGLDMVSKGEHTHDISKHHIGKLVMATELSILADS